MAVVRAVDHQDWDPREQPLLLGPSVGWDEHFRRAGCKCVGCLGGKERHGKGAQMAAGQPRQAVLPGPVPQELPGIPMVWSPGHLPSKASFPLAGNKALCPWASGGSGVVWLGVALGSGRKVFSSLTVGRFLFLRTAWSPVGCIAPRNRGAPAPAPVVVTSPFVFLCPQAPTLADGARGAGIVCRFFRVLFLLSFLLALSLSFSLSLTVFCLASELI